MASGVPVSHSLARPAPVVSTYSRDQVTQMFGGYAAATSRSCRPRTVATRETAPDKPRAITTADNVKHVDVPRALQMEPAVNTTPAAGVHERRRRNSERVAACGCTTRQEERDVVELDREKVAPALLQLHGLVRSMGAAGRDVPCKHVDATLTTYDVNEATMRALPALVELAGLPVWHHESEEGLVIADGLVGGGALSVGCLHGQRRHMSLHVAGRGGAWTAATAV